MSQQRPYDEEKTQQIKNMLGFGAEAPPEIVPESNSDAGQQPPPPVSPPAKEAEQPDLPKSDGDRLKFKLDKEKLLRALWTMASIVSMTVNVIVIIVVCLLVKYFPMDTLKVKVDDVPPEIGMNTPLDLLQGLYDNFELMDNAHIKTEIKVEDEIPVQFMLALDQETTVVLSQAVTISGARVALTTGGLNIFNAPATVTLPAGTKLPIFLNLEVPVDEKVPVSLNVEVDIPLNETDLHTPFVGLQEVVQPLYCLVKSDATNAAGGEICLKKIDQ